MFHGNKQSRRSRHAFFAGFHDDAHYLAFYYWRYCSSGERYYQRYSACFGLRFSWVVKGLAASPYDEAQQPLPAYVLAVSDP